MEAVIYILSLISLIYITVYTFLRVSGKERNTAKLRLAAFAAEGILAVLAVTDIIGVFETGGCSYLPAYCAVFGAIATVCCEITGRIPERFFSVFKYTLRSVLICAAAELFIFNFNSAKLIFGDYPALLLEPTQENCSNFDVATSQSSEPGAVNLEFFDVNIPVGTISVEASSNLNPNVKALISISDESNSSYSNRFYVATAEVIDGNTQSETVPANFSGNVKNMLFTFEAAENEIITVERIILNVPIFLSFSFVRFFIMLGALLAVYMMTASPLFKKSLSENKLGVRIAAYAMTAVFIGAALFLTNAYRFSDEEHSLKKDFTMTHGNQMTQELVDAFEAGQTSLLDTPSEDLLALENPYDWSQRNGIYYSWDHLLFEGKYYSYYGIAPVLTLFLPYHLITDHYFPTSWAVFIYGAIGIFFMTKLYMAFMFRFFPKIRSSLIVMGLFIMQLVTGIWFCFNTPNFYEIAQTSGFACVTAGAFLLISSNVIGDGKIKNWRLALSSVMLSLGVLCRPTLAIYCVVALLFIYAGFRKKKSLQSGEKTGVLHYVPYFVCALLPFVVIGSVQMIYNYARFGSFFDFGIQYSLTINDFTVSEYHTHFVLIGFFNYLLALPNWTETFPFIDCTDVKTFSPQGFYFIATRSAIGLLWKAFPILAYGWSRRAFGITTNENKRLYSVLLAATCVIAPAIIIFSIWESGYGARYCVDFAWQILIGALAVGFIVYNNTCEAVRRILNKLMLASAAVCLVLTFGQTYNWLLEGSLSYEWRGAILSFGRLFEFWR